MKLMAPDLPDFDIADWERRTDRERVRMMCASWAVQGFGAPLGAYLFYAAKLALYVWVWGVVATRAPGVGGWADIGSWWAEPVAFQKAILWTMLFEMLGLGCGSGPLTGRYVPPVVAFTHFLRPRTIRLPAFPRHVPLTAGHRRGLGDVLLYAAVVGFGMRALLEPVALLSPALLWPIVVLVPLLGLRDKTVFLAARAEHYWSTLVVFALAGDDLVVMLGGAMVVQLTIWWGAATSKLNHHFPSVITIMISNSPFLAIRPLRRRLYRDHPHDLTAAPIASWLAHGGTAIEYLFPLLLAVSDGGTPTTVGLVVMFSFHLFITSCFPMGVPLEWNVLFVYSMFVLFGVHAEASPLDVTGDPLLVAVLAAGVLVGPVLGNLRPDLVSFLPGMRYYAGNWATSVWVFRTGAADRLDECITKTAPIVPRQLRMLYDEDRVKAVMGKVRAFRSMHLHGRALNALVPRMVDEPGWQDRPLDGAAHEIHEGETVCGVVLGWNFGDGHLHDEQLLAAVQAECDFAPGDLRCLFLESQPMGRPWQHWRIVDAAEGLVEQGHVVVADLLHHQPCPDEGALDVGVLQEAIRD